MRLGLLLRLTWFHSVKTWLCVGLGLPTLCVSCQGQSCEVAGVALEQGRRCFLIWIVWFWCTFRKPDAAAVALGDSCPRGLTPTGARRLIPATIHMHGAWRAVPHTYMWPRRTPFLSPLLKHKSRIGKNLKLKTILLSRKFFLDLPN